MSLPESALPLPGSAWSVWRWCGLRSAGLPAALLEPLAAPELLAAADAVLDAETAAEEAGERAVAALRQLSAVPGAGSALRAARRALAARRSGRTLTEIPAAAEPAVAAYQAAREALESAHAALAAAVAAAGLRARASLRALLRRGDVQRALIWHNRGAYHAGLRWLLQQPPERQTSAIRRKERRLLRYLQRWAWKNDTIGATGPIGWARLAADGPLLTMAPGAPLARRHGLTLENWAVAALAEDISARHALRPWLAPQRSPLCALTAEGALFPLSARLGLRGLPGVRGLVPLTEAELLAAAACDGRTPASQIAAALAGRCDAGLELLAGLVDRGVLTWGLHPAPWPGAARSLRGMLEAIGDPELRAAALGPLDAVEAALAAIPAATEDPAALDAALGRLEEVFAAETGQAATRAAGQAYAGRTILTFDSERTVAVSFGPAFRDALAAPLDLLARSARWFTFAVAESVRAQIAARYQALAAESGSPAVDLLSLAGAVMPLLQAAEGSALISATAAFQARWQALLALPAGMAPAHRSSAALAPGIAACFDAPHAGWPMAQWVAPDVLLAAPSAAAGDAGRGQFVLGEIHLYNTLSMDYLEGHWPPGARAELAAYLPPGRALPCAPLAQTVRRIAPVSVSPDDRLLRYLPASGGGAPEQTLLMADLLVEPRGGQLIARTRDGGWSADLLVVFDQLLSHHCRALPGLADQGDTPRVTIDGVVAWRATWRLPAADLRDLDGPSDAALALAVRRWMRARQIPRRVFVRAPGEPKPIGVDLASPLALDMFAQLIRQTRAAAAPDDVLIISEMLPEPSALWLADSDDQRYTSELRMILRDPCPWQPRPFLAP